jgi:WD40 repeat protein
MNSHCIRFCFIVCGILLFNSLTQAQDFQILRKTGHYNQVIQNDISPDNKFFLSIDEQNKCIVWDIQTGEQITVISDVFNAKFADDNEGIYIATTDKTFYLASITGKRLKDFSQKAYKQELDRARLFYPEKSVLISENNLFDINKGYVKHLVYSSWGLAQAYSPAKNLYAVASKSSDTISLCNVTTGLIQSTIRSGIKNGHRSLSFSANGEKMVVNTLDTLQVLETQTGARLKTITVPRNSNMQISMAMLSPDGTRLFWTVIGDKASDKMICAELTTGKIIWQRLFTPFSYENGVTFGLGDCEASLSRDGKRLALSSVWRDQRIFDAETGKTIQEFKKITPVHLENIHKVPGTNEIVSLINNYASVWNLETGNMDRSMQYEKFYIQATNSSDFFSGINGVNKTLRRNKEGKVVTTYEGEYYDNSLQSSFDGKYTTIVQGHSDASLKSCKIGTPGNYGDRLSIIDVKTKQQVFSRSCNMSEAAFANTMHMVAIKPIDSDVIEFFTYTTGQKLYSIPAPTLKGTGTLHMSFSPDDRFLVIDGGREAMIILDLQRKTAVETTRETHGIKKNEYTHVMGFTPDSKYTVFYKGMGYIQFVELATAKINDQLTIKIPVYGSAPSVAFSKNGRFLFAGGTEGTVQVVDMNNQKIVARLYPFPQTGDWAVMTPSGLFDASQGAQNSMYYVSGKSVVPLGTMFEKFYTPKLLPRILNGEKFDPTPDVNKLKPVPLVTIQYKEGNRNLVVEDDVDKTIDTKSATGTITVKAECPADGVIEIRLFQNGKLVETTRNLVVEDDTKSSKTLSKTFQVALIEGNNIFKAVALNTERSESKPSLLTAVYRSEKKPEEGKTVTAGIQLHLVVVGINTYKNPRYNLNYATADAGSFRTAMEAGAKDIFSKVNTTYIENTNADKAAVMAAFEKVKAAANPEDLFVFYYAGHGVMNDKKEFFLVPYDVTQLYGNDGTLGQKGVSASVIQQYSKDIKAQKQLFVLDACQSAAALSDVVAIRGAAEEKAIAQLARSTGTHWLTASGSDQFAAEFSQLGHGSFTWCLLEALKGGADNGDKKITVKELDSYLQNKVPEITQKYRGSAQYPASFGYGNDFPVIIIK